MSILLLNSLIKAQQNFNLHFYLLFSSMKSGKIFASVALAALTAACTQESMQFEAAPGLQNRPTVNVELGFDESAVELGSEETRAFFGKPAGQGYQWIFEEGDKIGALLMDEWNGNGCGINNFTIKDYVHTNYAFIRETKDGETKWVTPAQAPVCEGNYFFYFPYNDTFNHRGYVGWDVNPVQPQYNENGELFQMQTVKENQKWIGYKYVGHELEGKVNKVNFDFVPLFAMPTFDIINKAGELTVNKLVVRATSNDDAEINPSGTHDLMATTMVLAPETGKFDQVNKTWESKNFAEHTSLMYKHAQRYTKFGEEDYVWPTGVDNADWGWNAKGKNLFPLNENHTSESIRKQAAYEYVADYSGVEGGYKVEQFGHIQALLVMPAGYYYWNQRSGQTFEALIYVTTKQGDDYVVRIDLGRPQTQGATSGSNFDDVNSGAAPKFLAPGVNTKFLAEFDATAMQSYDITDFKVTSSADLAWVIKEAEANQGYYDLNITTSGKRVELNNDIYELLAARPKVRLHINGEITITADSDDAINKLYFDNDNMFTTLNINTPQVKKAEPIYAEGSDDIVGYSKVLGNCEINVAKGGALDTKANGIDIVANVNNDGTVNAKNITGDVLNNGTLTADNIYGENELICEKDHCACSSENVKNHKVSVLNNNELTVKGTVQGDMCNWNKATVKTVKGQLRNMGTMTVNNAPNFSNKQSGTLTFAGSTDGIVSGEDGSENRGGKVIVSGATKFYYFWNDGATVEVNADVTMVYQMKNYNDEHKSTAKIIVASNATLKGGKINNCAGAVIDVKGKLVDGIYNAGVINVIENGLVIADGIFDDKAGIIDVTKANAGTESQAAKSFDTAMQFRYTVQGEKTAADLQKALKARISAHNYGIDKSPVILIWDANSPAEFKGTDLSGTANVQYITFDRDLTIIDSTRFFEAKSIIVNKILTLGNGTEMGFNVGSAVVTINGTVKANNHSVLAPETAKYTGAGTFYAANATVKWGEYNWTGNRY